VKNFRGKHGLLLLKNISSYVVAIYKEEWFLPEMCMDQSKVAEGYKRHSFIRTTS
jgi:disulfide oxidoreductase YuzD